MNSDSQRRPALLIADVLEKYLGEIVSLEDQLEISFAYSQHNEFGYAFIGSDLYKINIQNKYWDTGEVQRKLENLEKTLKLFISDFNDLPNPIWWTIEQDALQFIKKNDDEFESLPTAHLAHKYDVILPIFHAFENLRFMLDLNESETAFDRAKKANMPVKDIRLRQSSEKFRKILIIDKLRFLWIKRKKETPNSIPYEGSEFGDMVSEIFEILNIKSDVRAAMDAWRKETNT